LQALVQRYLDTCADGTAADVAALYTEDATLEDPVGGGEVHIGRQAIAGFYTLVERGEINTELLTRGRSGGGVRLRHHRGHLDAHRADRGDDVRWRRQDHVDEVLLGPAEHHPALADSACSSSVSVANHTEIVQKTANQIAM